MTEQQQAPEAAAPQPAAAPPMPDIPPTPDVPPAVTVLPGPPPGGGSRRRLRAVLRWTAAVVVFAVAGAGTANGITGMERTDIPGLATASDGRWDYPQFVRPPLPSGSPPPLAESNMAGTHYADLRALVLPAPTGAREDRTLRGTDGWLQTKDFLAEYTLKDERKEFGQRLTDHGLRHIAARGWTTQDGTHTRIYLLQFNSAALVDNMVTYGEALVSYDSPRYQIRGAETPVDDEDFPLKAQLQDIRYYAYTEAKPYGAEQVRQAYLTAGDTLAVIVQSRKGTTASVPFQQTVMLQSELLA
ncbi:hypothetical protein ACIHCX_31015 [Streptomyces sp. NPDC052043]|uniref:hypothetical protein n=1 Tax=Streptomyces sp. NPDC052043 TaxID=3365684 RepID=UPI0037D50CCA